MADALRPYEQIEARKVEPQLDRTVYQRVYIIPVDQQATILASIVLGTAVDLDGMTGTGLSQPRVHSFGRLNDKGRSSDLMAFSFYVPRWHSGGSPELWTSRRLWADAFKRYAEKIVLSSDGTTSVPVAGDFYLTDSGLLGRMCVSVSFDLTSFPGLYRHVAVYSGPLAF